MEDMIQMGGQAYVLATSPLADQTARVLKHGDAFAVFDSYGDIRPIGTGAQGLYYEATRFLSHFEFRIGKTRPFLLNSSIVQDNSLLNADFTNPDMIYSGNKFLPRGTIHIARSKFLWQKACYERFQISNFGLEPVEFEVFFRYKADFADIFEVRGTKRLNRGEFLPYLVEGSHLSLAYRGLDNVVRKTRFDFFPEPQAMNDCEAKYNITLQPKEKISIFITVLTEVARPQSAANYQTALIKVQDLVKLNCERSAEILTSHALYNDWLSRSQSDLHMMLTETAYGLYPYAGVPWYNTVFGRDGIMTALESLWIDPEPAKGVLKYLATTQATEHRAEWDAEPGKILHEVRAGEMVDLGEVPFKKYYGSADATPLFIVLAAAYYERTADREFLEFMWPHVQRALQWIDSYGDRDGDGFVEYERRSKEGLLNQGWKDSNDSVSHSNGHLAEGPIALCEVQGYVYQAKRGAAKLASVLGHEAISTHLLSQSEILKEKFNAAFWSDKLGCYALALDGDKKPCLVKSSNAGHCLYSGIATPERAEIVTKTLMGAEMFSGWGIRTLGSAEARYNPMSYHNGSIWPHDNAFIVLGMARYGMKAEALQVTEGMFETSLFLDLNRLPELFCGFSRQKDEAPTLYPVACAPQSWASGAVFLLMQACLGITIDASRSQICFHHPQMPREINEIVLKGLRVNNVQVDLRLSRYGDDVSVNVLRKTGPIDILLVK